MLIRNLHNTYRHRTSSSSSTDLLRIEKNREELEEVFNLEEYINFLIIDVDKPKKKEYHKG